MSQPVCQKPRMDLKTPQEEPQTPKAEALLKACRVAATRHLIAELAPTNFYPVLDIVKPQIAEGEFEREHVLGVLRTFSLEDLRIAFDGQFIFKSIGAQYNACLKLMRRHAMPLFAAIRKEIQDENAALVPFYQKLVSELHKDVGLDVALINAAEIRAELRLKRDRLQEIEALFIYRNPSVCIPKEIGLFTNVTHLNYTDCKLNRLPVELQKLAHLKRINLNNNELKSIPDWINEFPNLSMVFLKENRLTECPIDRNRLKTLTMLSIGGNKIKKVPNSIHQEPKLQYLEYDCPSSSGTPRCSRRLFTT